MRTRETLGQRATGWLLTGSVWPVVALSLVVGVIQIAGSIGAADNQPDRDQLDNLAWALLLAGPVALAARNRHPLPVLVTVVAATLLYVGLGYPYGPIFLSLVIALFTAVNAGYRLAAWVAAGVTYGFLVAGDVWPPKLHLAAVAAWLVVVLVVSEAARVRRERMAEALHAREEEARRQAGEERLRIARELHDVLAHNISLINVQAGTALHLMDEQPEQARTALAAIKDASKEALRELRSVLDVLRARDEEPPRSPTPGLAHLDDLVARSEAAGLDVDVEVEGVPRQLPAEIDRAAFRIAQEALTNVTRHAVDASATVRVAYGDEDLTVQVVDDGRGAPTLPAPGAGSGIAGMRERAAALGGQLDAGPRPGGGFRVRARLPLDGAP
jgi:signal transduction histidine kinase